MKNKIIAFVYTTLFFVEQLIIPKVWPVYLEWIGHDEDPEPVGLVMSCGLLWFGQIALAYYLWYLVFNPDNEQ
mgnify:CR=1 FL=1